MRKIIWLAAAVLTCGAYVAWPFWSAHQLRVALETGDAAVLSRKVDWPSIRASVKEMLTAEMAKSMAGAAEKDQGAAALGTAFAAMFLDKVVDGLVSPHGLAAILQGELKGSKGSPKRHLQSDSIKRASLVGPTRFEFEVGPPGDSKSFILGVMQLRDFEWKLTGIVPLQPLSATGGTPPKGG